MIVLNTFMDVKSPESTQAKIMATQAIPWRLDLNILFIWLRPAIQLFAIEHGIFIDDLPITFMNDLPTKNADFM